MESKEVHKSTRSSKRSSTFRALKGLQRGCLIENTRKHTYNRECKATLLILTKQNTVTIQQCLPPAPDRQAAGSSCSWGVSSLGSSPSPTSETHRELHLPHTAGTSWYDSAGRRSVSSDRLLYTDNAEYTCINNMHMRRTESWAGLNIRGLTCSSLKSGRIIPPPASSCLIVYSLLYAALCTNSRNENF